MLFYDERLTNLSRVIAEHMQDKARYFEINQLFPERFWQQLVEEVRLFELLTNSQDREKGIRTFIEAIRLLSREFAALASIAAAQGIYGIWTLQEFGSSEQQAVYLPQWSTGQTLTGFAFSEENWDVTTSFPETVARQTKEGWVLTGHKHMVSNAGLARHLLVLAQTVNQYGEKGTGIFLVDTQATGVIVGEQLDKPGLRAMPLAPISFDQVTLPPESLLGHDLNGFAHCQAIMTQMRLAISAQSLGIAEGIFAKGLADSQIKRHFGKRPIDVPLNQDKFAEMEAKLAACTAYYDVYMTTTHPEARQIALLKLLTARTAQEVSEEVVRITGIYSFIANNDLERYVRDAAVVANYGGSLNSLKLQIAQQWL